MDGVVFSKDENTYYFACPHCEMICQVPRELIQCKIFRHAVYKKNMKFVNPHASKDECERWLKDDIVYGCTKPFRFDGTTVEKCDYI